MIIFVSDVYADEYVGGAELSTEGLISNKDIFTPIVKLKSEQVTEEIIDNYSSYHWVFTNTSMMKKDCFYKAIKKLNYSVVEYDYKFCSFRSIEKHESIEEECLCHQSSYGKLFAVFLAKARGVYFMSSKQRDIYFSKFPFLEKANTHVLSSIFSPGILQFIQSLNDKYEKTEDSYLILHSTSWVKGTNDSIEYAKRNNIKYEIVGGLEYPKLLEKLRKHKGLIFQPSGADTCPRLVIEAALLGCDLILNDNVQHKDEEWFTGSKDKMVEYLLGRSNYFWKSLYDSLSQETIIPTETQSPDQKYIFIVPVYNSQDWIDRTLFTIDKQRCSNFECYIGDDVSTDNTCNTIEDTISQKLFNKDKFTLLKNKTKKYALQNISDLIDIANPSDEDIIVILDGDDWLSNPYVLDTLNKEYTKNTLVTFGSFIQYPTANIGFESSQYPKEVVDNNSYRKDAWRASHLRTMKYKVWKDIDKEDLKNKDGIFFDSAYDQAIMLPALEMCGHRAKYLPKILCVYNTGNPNAVVKDRQNKQHQNMLEIRAKKPYDRKHYD